MKSSINLCFILVFVKFTSIISVPHEFCLEPFNDNDCGESPTLVFYYYKPGSRCEIRTWRGCPTLNKFPDEYLCSHYCIGKMSGRIDDVEMEEIIAGKESAKTEWVKELETLDIKDIVLVDQILEEVRLENEMGKLTFEHVNNTEKDAMTEKPTEAEKEVTAEIPIEAATEAPTTEAATTEPETTTEGTTEPVYYVDEVLIT